VTVGVIGTSGDIIMLTEPRASGLIVNPGFPSSYRKQNTDPVRLFAKLDAFRTVAEAIAQGISSVPFNVYERDTKNGRRKLAAEEDAVAAALEDGGGRGQFRFIEALQLDYVLHDRWAFLPMYDAAGRLEFVRLPGRRISFALDDLERITHVVLFNSRGQELPIPIDRVVFDVGYDPSAGANGRTVGYGISNSLEQAAIELEKGAAFRDSMLEGGPRVPMYISRPVDAPAWIKNGERGRFTEEFREYSTTRAGQTPILEDGMELKAAPRIDTASVEYRETRLAAQVEISIAMHYPPELIGYREGNFNSIDALKEQLYVETLGGKIIAFRQSLNIGLRRCDFLDDDRYIEENLAVRLASTPEKQASVLQTQTGAPIRTRNEARKLLNLPPIEGGDALIVPLNVIAGGLASPTDTGPKAALPALHQRRAIEPTHTKAETYGDRLERAFSAALATHFAGQESRVLAALGSESSPAALDVSFDAERENASLADLIYAHSFGLAAVGASSVLESYPAEFEPERMLAWLRKAAEGDAASLNAATSRKLAVAIFGTDWPAEAAAVFAALRSEGPDKFATTIATASINFGASDAARVAGLGLKTWHANSADSRHADLDGQTVAVGDLFSNGGRWPGDPVLGSAENLWCHCRVEFSPAD
jgi:hypothetical protein